VRKISLLLLVLCLCAFNYAQHSAGIIARKNSSQTDSWGAATAFSGSPEGIRGVANTAKTHISLAYIDASDGNAGDIIVGSVNTVAKTISFGSPVEFDDDIRIGNLRESTPGVSWLDSDGYVGVVFSNDSAGDDGYLETYPVTGTSIGGLTYSDEYDTTSSRPQDVVDVASSKLMIGYTDDGAAIDGAVYTMDGSGSEASSSLNQNHNAVGASTLKLDKLDTDKFIMIYRNDDDNDKPTLVAGTIATNTITWGTDIVPDDDIAQDLTSSWRVSVVALDTDRFVGVTTSKNSLSSTAPPYRIWAFAGTVSGTTITLGDSFAVSDEDGLSIVVGKVSATEAMVTWRTNDADYPNTNTLAYKVITVDWGTRTITGTDCPLMPTKIANVIDDSKVFVDVNIIPVINMGDN